MKFLKIVIQIVLMVLCFILGTKYTQIKEAISQSKQTLEMLSKTPEPIIEEEIVQPLENEIVEIEAELKDLTSPDSNPFGK